MNLEYGIVTTWDPKTCQIRVELCENGLSSYWLQVPQGYTKSTKRRCPVELGTQVAILLKDNGVDGILLGAVYSEAEPPPITDDDTDLIEYKDGTTLSYSPSAHKLDINLSQGTVNIIAPNGVMINASAGITIKGTVNVQGDIIADGISLKSHTHSGVESGKGSTGPAQ